MFIELSLYCALRYLAGGRYQDVRLVAGVARSTFYHLVWEAITAINRCPELLIQFPTTINECSTAATDFKKLSADGVMDRCIGAIDGWLCRIVPPSVNETDDVLSYFSGHYQYFPIG